jgi:uncharacterized RDD family membrane protein YckC/phage baseplate assembly protein W
VTPVGQLLRPVRAVAKPTAERAVDAVLAGPLPEAVARSAVEHRVAERVADEVLAGVDVERALRGLLASPTAERILRSPEFDRLLRDILERPQVREALTHQSTSMAAEAVAAARVRAVRADNALERAPRRWLRRPARTQAVPFAGLATRGVALAVDALAVTLLFLTGAAFVGLVSSFVGELRPVWVAAALSGAAWLVLHVAYFAGFWTTVGQTPGMRLMRLRVVGNSGASPGLERSLVRFAGLVLAIIPCLAGFLPALVDGKRRALPDFLAGTVVVYDSPQPDEAAARSAS